MNGTDIDEITAYVEAVRAALVGLPEATRDELTEDLPEHLAEVLADGVGSLTERLGTPEAYATELRISAGFVGGFPDPPPTTDPLARVRERAMLRLRAADARVGPLLGYPRVSEFLQLLRPAWWVLRGYLAAMVLAWILDDSSQPMGLLPRIGGSDVVALLLLAAGVLGSIWFGRRGAPLERLPRYALYAGSAVLVLVALSGFLSADSNARGADFTDVGYSDPYNHVEDVYIYDGQGRLVEGARLFDQNGMPIRLGRPYCFGDDHAGGEVAADDSKYPYCPENAPFRLPGEAGSASVPSARPTPSEGAASAATPSAAPSPSR
ncbi:HAAS signaling domain-containing protein [Jidongwangia harbinensis]|uniref:HAAS signaling domain-containing protein n=1 Tax=Jidongwangia harbinensis TaxID=2878561 RepID=UPI001CDA3BBA|nr:hypothetical protein [Jidongwangia harbinensis]MCA2215658.1 hypothetical protein [Jidongwangia harbinensis]